ncbi:MAG: universal stress protein [Gaiellales bacterium]|nr:universal stress protein [Gaiellales bacterium]
MIPQTILVPTDGSPGAQAAESMAAELAGVMGSATVKVVHVIPMSCLYGDVSLENVVQVKQVNYVACTLDQRMGADKLVADATARVKAQVESAKVNVVGKVLESPSPAEAIMEEAHADGTCSLIVMGSRGMGGFRRLALGSVSNSVVHGAHCPVMIVKTDE